MTDETKILKKVRETFNIFNDGRMFNNQPQKFMLSALKRVISSPKTQERIKLNEAIGYFGHFIREKTRLDPSEQETIVVDGKAIVVPVIPAIRTTYLDIDDDGNVTHEQEFFDNPLGKAALNLYEQKHGGFSWALGGSNGRGLVENIANAFFGFDYVFKPNFIAKERQAAILSSMANPDDAEDSILSSLIGAGFCKEDSESLLSSITKNNKPSLEADSINDLIISSLHADLEEEKSRTASIIEENQSREKLLSSVIDNTPFLISEEQRTAFLNMKTEEDQAIVSKLFSSMAATNFDRFPNERELNEAIEVKEQEAPPKVKAYPSFDAAERSSVIR